MNIAKDRKEWTRLEEKIHKEMCKMTEKKYATWSLNKAAAAQRSRAS